jgi:hypothetical protein
MNFLKIRKQIKEGGNPDRYRGQTLAIALETIAEALREPNTPVAIKDHVATRCGSDNLSREIYRRIADMQLEGFFINREKLTVTFSLDVEQ